MPQRQEEALKALTKRCQFLRQGRIIMAMPMVKLRAETKLIKVFDMMKSSSTK